MDHAGTSRYSQQPTAELVDTMGQLHGVVNAALAELLAVHAELTRREAYRDDGCRDEASWLQQRLGVARSTAKTWAATGAALESLPHLRAAFSSGTLSFDKTAAAASFADPDSDEVVTKEAQSLSVSALRSAGRRLREVTADEEAGIRSRRSLAWRWLDGGTTLSLSGRLPAEDGARVIAAIDRRAKQLPVTDVYGMGIPLAARRATALTEIASTAIAADPDPDRATVVVTAGLDELVAGGGAIAGGGIVSSTVMERLLCDCRIQLLLEDPDGKVLGASTMTRTISPSLRRALRERDRECRFPGCSNDVFMEGHHMIPVPAGGPTDIDHLACFCRFHHMLFHEGRWRIEGDPNGDLVFIRPGGTVLHEGPPPLDYDVQKWLWEDLVPAGGP